MGQESSGVTPFSISITESSVVPFLSARVAEAWNDVNLTYKICSRPHTLWQLVREKATMTTWITGPSASGSEYGTPTSITSEPQELRIFNAFDVVARSGSPAVMNGMNAIWKFPRLDLN